MAGSDTGKERMKITNKEREGVGRGERPQGERRERTTWRRVHKNQIQIDGGGHFGPQLKIGCTCGSI